MSAFSGGLSGQCDQSGSIWHVSQTFMNDDPSHSTDDAVLEHLDSVRPVSSP